MTTMTIMTKNDFVEKLKLASRQKTLYCSGGFGQRLTDANKRRLAKMYPRNAERVGWAEADGKTYAFDCIGLAPKGILWGWNADKVKSYGGAEYCANGVPDVDEEHMLAYCYDISKSFGNIEVGEYVYMKGHCGIYIGDGLVIESSPKWANGVQVTACNCNKAGFNRRDWECHGKLPWIDYAYCPSVKEWQLAAIADGYKFPKYGADGEWGAECESVAKKAIVKYNWIGYRNKHLTRIVQRVCGVAVDGLCGTKTRAAIKAYQQSHGLKVDGEVGLETWKAMLQI